MFYLDTSVLIAALVGEASMESILGWLGEHADNHIAISEWTVTEFSAALSMKARVEQMLPEKRQLALTGFNRMVAQSLEMLPVLSRHFTIAAQLADHIDSGLRSGDALHLAVAMEANAEIVTLDKRFAAAAKTLAGRATLL